MKDFEFLLHEIFNSKQPKKETFLFCFVINFFLFFSHLDLIVFFFFWQKFIYFQNNHRHQSEKKEEEIAKNKIPTSKDATAQYSPKWKRIGNRNKIKANDNRVFSLPQQIKPFKSKINKVPIPFQLLLQEKDDN